MSDKSETRVVSIQFDNKDFERNVQQSLDTLTRLNKALEFKDGSKGLTRISDAASKVNLSPINDSVAEVTSHFSKLEVIGVTALANLTNSAVNAGKKLVSSFIQPLTKGGMERALNMEKANFMFEGLNYTVKQIGKVGQAESIMDNIYKSVEGTVYSLDRASVLASQLMASGIVGTGKNSQLTHVLKSIAGVASVYSADYERVGEIFATIKAQGVVMGNQVDSLRTMGVPVYRKLADYLNKINDTTKYNEKTIQDMIRKKEIDFDTFSAAMEDAFGDQAAKSKETFVGALEDMKAAAARIGESFYKPLLKGGRDFYNASVPVLDAIKSRLTNEALTGPIDKFGIAFQEMVSKVIVGMDLFAAALNFDQTKEEIEALVKAGLADESRLKNLETYANVIERIRSILGAFGKALNFVKTILSSAWNLIKPVLKMAEPLTGLVSLLGDGIIKMGWKLAEATVKMTNFTENAVKFVDALVEAVQNSELFSTVADKIRSALTSGASFASSFGDSLVTLSEKISQVVYNLTDGLFNALVRAKEGMQQIIKMSDLTSTAIGLVLASKVSSLASIFGTTTQDGTNFWLLLKKFGANTFAGLKAASGAIYDAMFELNKTLEVYQRSLNADILLKIALAIGALALSIKLLSTIDPTALMGGVAALGVLAVILKKTLTDVVTVVKLMSGLNLKQLLGLALVTDGLIKIAISLLGMATAVKILASLDLQGAIQGVAALEIISKMLVRTLRELSTIPKLQFLTINLTFLALAIDILAVAFKLLGSMDWEQIAHSTAAMGVMAAGLVIMMKELSKLSKAENGVKIGSILLIALALDMLAVAFKVLGNMNWEQFAVATSSMIVLCSGLAVMMGILSKMDAKGSALKNAASLVVVALAMGALGRTFAKLGDLEWEQVGRAAVGMLAIEFFIGSLMDIMSTIKTPEDLLTRIGALIGVAFSIGMLAKAFVRLGNMEWEQIGKAAAGMASIEALMLGMMKVMQIMQADPKELLIMAAGMVAMGIAMQIFAAGVGLLGSMDITTLAKGIIGFATAMVIFGVVANSVQEFIPAMLKLAGTMALLGLAVGAIGLGLMALGYGLQSLAGALAVLTGDVALKFAVMVVVLAVLAPLLKTAGVAMLLFGAGIAAVGIGMVLVGAGLAAIGLGLKVITTSMEEVVASINAFANIDWKAVGNVAELVTIFGLLSPLAIALGIGLAAVGAGLVTIGLGVGGIAEGFMLIKKAISGIFDTIGSKVEAMLSQTASQLKLFKDTVKTFADVIKALLKTLKEGIKGINDLYNTAYKSGKHVVDGVVKGIKDGSSSAAEAARSLAKQTLQAYKNELGISSPSKEMAKAGRWTVMGLVKGLNDNTDMAIDSMSTFAQAVMSAYTYVSDNMDVTPTIAPVLDTSNIVSGIDTIDTMMSTQRAMTLSSKITGADRTANDPMHKLIDTLDTMTESMNSRSLNVYNTIEGASDPDAFADRLTRRFRLNARTI